MMRLPPGTLSLACLWGIAACAQGPELDSDPGRVYPGLPSEAPDRLEEAQALSQLESFLGTIEGLQWQVMDTGNDGYVAYLLEFNQPIDHAESSTGSFRQRIILHHRDELAPMVLYTSGYSIFSPEYLAELSLGMGANQINVEQRFFGTSKPADMATGDWEHLRIEEAASDHHRIIQALSGYYQGSWLSTGHSKGGMSSIYHRRFFPDDVDATVAYVAPISFAAPDTSYDTFAANIGPEECRITLRSAQILALERFPALLDLAQVEAEAQGLEFERAGGQARAFETAIAAMEWSFWQERSEAACTFIPNGTASDDELFEFVRKTVGLGADDQSLSKVDSYYFQASYQLGYPAISQEHLGDLLQYQDVALSLNPPGSPTPTFDGSAMPDIQSWLDDQTDARILFVYGESDPWTGGAFDMQSCRECPSFRAIGKSHAVLLKDLPEAEQAEAANALERWTGIRPALGLSSTLSVRGPLRARVLPPLVSAASPF